MDTANRTNFPDRLYTVSSDRGDPGDYMETSWAGFYVVCVCVSIVPFVFVLGFCALVCVNVRNCVLVRVHVPVHITVAFVTRR